MTKEEIANLLNRFKTLGLILGAMIQDEERREVCWFQLERLCARPLREFLLITDPDEDPTLYLQALQAVEGLREDQAWLRRYHTGQGAPANARWQ